MKKKWLAILLAISLGTWGVHRFYLRQTELGIVYLGLGIFFTNFSFFKYPISALLGFYDAYKLMIMDGTEFDRRYNSRFFRDRYGNRIQETHSQKSRNGRYILMDEDHKTTVDNRTKYFDLSKRKRESETFKQSGIKKFKDYDVKGAIIDFEKAIELNLEDKALLFNIACCYSLNEEALKAFQSLDRARVLGFTDTDRILTHESLAFIRIMPEFELFKKNDYKLNDSMISSLKNKDQDLLNQLNSQRAKLEKVNLDSLLNDSKDILA